MTEPKQKPSWRGDTFGASTLMLMGLLFVLLSVAPASSDFHIDADPWIGVAIIAIGGAIRAIALWRSAYEDD